MLTDTESTSTVVEYIGISDSGEVSSTGEKWLAWMMHPFQTSLNRL